jgi:hypothetical protein
MKMPNISDAARKEAEARAQADYDAVVGKTIEIHQITGYDERDNSVEVDGVSIQVRVDSTDPSNLRHWCDEYLDPYWDVTPIGDHPQLAGLRSLWTYGPSYKVVEGAVVAAEGSELAHAIR